MLKNGSYVRMVLSPQTQRGTITEEINHRDQPQFVFRTDPRFTEQVEAFIYDGDVEEGERPSDIEVARINALLKANPVQ